MSRIMSVMMIALVMVLGTMFPAGTDVLTQEPQNNFTDHGNESANMTYGVAQINATIYVEDSEFDSNWNCEGGVGLFDLDLNNHMENMSDPNDWLVYGFNITGTGTFLATDAPSGDYHMGAGLDCTMDDGTEIGYHMLMMDSNSTNNSLETFTLVNYSELVVDMFLQMDMDNGEAMFHCGNGDDIAFAFVNDGYEDCTDGSDEPQYDSNGTLVNWFDCHDGSTVGMDLVNDGNWDCPDGEDEGEFGGNPGGDRMFDCADGMMSVKFVDVNNGIDDCTDGSDEPQFDASGNETSYYMCDGGNQTIPLSWVNDGGEDCEYGDDEGFGGGTSEDRMFDCADGMMSIYFFEVNNGYADCTDGSDEPQYDASGNETSYYMCEDGNYTILLSLVNDGTEDCEYGDDESDMGGNGASGWIEFDNEDAIFDGGGYYYFSNSVSMYDLEENQSYLINISIYDNNGDLFGSLEYYDISGDENGSATTDVGQINDLTDGCYAAYVMLYDSMGNYIDNDWMFFGVGSEDCDDETGGERMYDCADGMMSIYFFEVNNGYADCTDGSDEPQYDASGNETSYYFCEDENYTIVLSWVNDGTEDCLYGDDEADGGTNGEDRMFDCADGNGMTHFSYVNDGDEDCEDGSDEPQYDASGSETSEYMCYGGNETIPLSWVNDGGEDCEYGDDEADDNGGDDGPGCISTSILLEVIGDSDNAQFEISMLCELDEDTSAMWRMMMDMNGNNDSIVTQDEVDNLLAMMSEEDEEDNENEDWSANGIMLSMTDSTSFSNAIGLGNISMVSTQTSEMFSIDWPGQSTVTISSDISDDGPDDDCPGVVISDSENWNVTSVEMSATDWTVSDEGDHFSALGCGSPGLIDIEFTYTVEEIVEEIVDESPMCMVSWTYSTDTNWESGTELIVDASGDHTLNMSSGSYYLGIFCTDDEGDIITIELSTADGSLSVSQTGTSEVSGWVDLVIPEGLTATIPVDYQWDSSEFSGAGTITVSFTSEAGADTNATIDDIETDSGGFLPGFTSILTISAMMGAVMFLSRREEE